MTTPEIAFAPLAPEHLELLHGWLQRPHVREFWDDGHRTTEQVRTHYFGADLGSDPDEASFVFTLAGLAAGYLQTYRVSAGSEHGQWRSPRGETWGLDLLLGAAADTGRGYGPQVIRDFTVFWRRRRPHLSRLLIDPDVRNVRAVRAYQKAGFSGVGEMPGPAATLKILAADL